MKRFFIGIGLSASFIGTAPLTAQEVTWRTTGERVAAPSVSIGMPRGTSAEPAPAPVGIGARLGAPRPAASIGLPVAAAAPVNELFRPVVNAGPTIRGQAPEVPKVPPVPKPSVTPKTMPTPSVTEGTTPKAPAVAPPAVAPPTVAPPSTNPPASAIPFGYATPYEGTPAYGYPASPIPANSPEVEMPYYGTPGYDFMSSVTPSVHDNSSWYGSVEYLLWYTRSASLPALFTSGAVIPGSTQPIGALGSPGTSVLYGGQPADLTRRSGGRLNLGYWFGCGEKVWGVDAAFFFLGDTGDRFGTNSNAVPVIARPFYSANRGREFSELIAAPGLASGEAAAQIATSFWGADISLRRRLVTTEKGYFDLSAGYRFLDLRDDLRVSERFIGMPGTSFSGENGSISDRFQATNQFHGPQIAALFSTQRGRWSFDFATKLAAGVSVQSVEINGGYTPIGPNASPRTLDGGLLTTNSNIGHYTRSEFAVVPEFTFNLGYNFTPHARIFVGYNFLYWSNVLRSGDQIDRVIDERRIAAPQGAMVAPRTSLYRPVPLMKDTDFWAQGLNFGLRFSW